MSCSNSTCNEDINHLLLDILIEDIAIYNRWSQVIQAFGGTASETHSLPGTSCISSERDLLLNILSERNSIFNRLFDVIAVS